MSDEAAKIAAVILAAGRSRRFGREDQGSKVVAPLNGVPLVRAVAMAALRSRAMSVTVVTGHDCDNVDAALTGLDVQRVHNFEFESGMASSLVAGLASLPDDRDGMLVLLGDMPLVRCATLDKLIARFEQRDQRLDAVVPTYRGVRGNPVLIGSRLFPAMRGLRGDQGARQLLASLETVVASCEVDDPGIAIDIDTRDALLSLQHGA